MSRANNRRNRLQMLNGHSGQTLEKKVEYDEIEIIEQKYDLVTDCGRWWSQHSTLAEAIEALSVKRLQWIGHYEQCNEFPGEEIRVQITSPSEVVFAQWSAVIDE